MKEKKIKLKKNRSGLVLIGCFIVAVVLFIVCLTFINNTTEKIATKSVVVFNTDVAGSDYIKIDSSNAGVYLTTKDAIVANLPTDTYESIEDALSNGVIYVHGNYTRNVPLTKAMITKEDDVKLSFSNRVEIGIKVKSFENAAGGHVRAGQRVNIAVIDSDGNVADVAKNVYVASALGSDGGEISNSDKDSIATGFVLWMEDIDASSLIRSGIYDGNVIITIIDEKPVM